MKNLNLTTNLMVELDVVKGLGGENRMRLGALLLQVKETRCWSGEFSSFSKWLVNFGKTNGFSLSALWRYVSAQAKYNELASVAAEFGYDLPLIKDLAKNISPERIEALYKLAHVLPEGEVSEMLSLSVQGKLSRTEVRAKWLIYKQLIGEDGLLSVSHRRVNVLNAVRVAGLELLGAEEGRLQHYFSEVEVGIGGVKSVVVDGVIAMDKEDVGALSTCGVTVHGFIAVVDDRGMEANEFRLRQCRGCFDYVWIVTNDVSHVVGNAGNGVGLIEVKDGALTVVVAAKGCGNLSGLTRTLQALLVRNT